MYYTVLAEEILCQIPVTIRKSAESLPYAKTVEQERSVFNGSKLHRFYLQGITLADPGNAST
jgi:hypothetical protein